MFSLLMCIGSGLEFIWGVDCIPVIKLFEKASLWTILAQELGLTLVYTLVSNQDDWDRYEGLQWYAADKWARENPDDPDVEALLKRIGENREYYLRWGRETFGWAIYLFKK